ncbi:hypothetical protein FRC09_009289 [Ceratobasidium sp. 395]|nr:hypothetical protein FRC09_009289 [Ceratobasidium sp. 395]
MYPKSEGSRLIATAVATCAATVLAFTAYQSASKRKRRLELQREVKDALASTTPEPSIGFSDSTLGSSELRTLKSQISDSSFDENIIREMLARNYAFLGEESMRMVRAGRVVIVGCGGVGSWAAVMLMRSGVSHIRLIDFDMVTLSSLNRHAVATLADVGVPKVTACKNFFRRVAPWVEVDTRKELWKLGSGGESLLEWDDKNVDWVIDAIDNMTTKVQLLRYCKEHNIKVRPTYCIFAQIMDSEYRYSLQWALEPNRIPRDYFRSDISNTFEDPLARSVRRRLRLDGIESGIPVVYSTEKPSEVKLLPLPQDEFEKGNVHELGTFDDFRVRILPVLGPLPALFGLHIATYIICDIAGKPLVNPSAVKNRAKLYDKLARDLLNRESRNTGGVVSRLPISEQDIAYIFEDLHRGRSTIPPHVVLPRPQLARWDIREPLTTQNCVVLSHQDAQTLQDKGGIGSELVGEGIWPAETLTVVQSRQQEAARIAKWIL